MKKVLIELTIKTDNKKEAELRAMDAINYNLVEKAKIVEEVKKSE